MITQFSDVQNVDVGEQINIIGLGNTDETYEMSVYSTRLNKFSTSAYEFTSNTPVVFTVTKTPGFLITGSFLYKFLFNTSKLQNSDTLLIQINNPVNPTESYTRFVQVGKQFVNTPNTVHVYGYVYDAYGNPVVGEAISFTVLNVGNMYFDNAATTAWTATAITDKFGRYDLYLNRQYDYVMAIERLNYTKKVALTTVPANVTEVEVLVGKGSAC